MGPRQASQLKGRANVDGRYLSGAFLHFLPKKPGIDKACRGLRIDRLEQFLVPIETGAQQGEKDGKRTFQKDKA
jgi:hypothetical protein